MLVLAQQVKALAQGLGFEACGITPAEPLIEAYERYLQAVFSGRLTGLRYLTENPTLRQHPRTLLPSAQSLILCLKSYYQGVRLHPPIAQYAWGEDYHRVLRRKLDIISDYLRRKGGFGTEVRPFVDTAPILEKPYAQQAGLGWIGKNTLLISPKLGSYTFIAGLATNLPLPPDAPLAKDLCGTCQRCVEACPTGALEPYKLDVRRCIAYWTIEAPALSEGMPPTGEWLFGCDICQAVCPWNRFAWPHGEIAFTPQPYVAWDVEMWAAAPKSQIRRMVRLSALRRARPEKLLHLARQKHNGKHLEERPGREQVER
jgi:epoxyqueuosine reductase